MSATETVTVDRELLHSLLVEAQGIIEIMERLAGCTEPHVVERLSTLTCEVAELTGILPSTDEYRTYAESPEGQVFAALGESHPVLEAFWADGERRRDELLGYARDEATA